MPYVGELKKRVPSEEPEDQEWYLHSLIEAAAGKNGTNEEEQLMLILEADYKKVRHRDKAFGNTLLHHAMQHSSSAGLVDFLLEEWPEAAEQIQDPSNDHIGPTAKPNYTWYPLHIGAMSGAPAETMQMVLEAWPEAAQKPDTLDTSLPLHLCIGRETDEAVLRLLLEAYPKGAETLAGNQELPLHKAVAKASPAVVKALLAAFPRGVKQRTFPLDNWTPLEMAKERLKDGKVGTAAQAQEIIDAIAETKAAVDAEFKQYVKANVKAPPK